MSNRQTVFFLPVDPMDKNHKDLDTIDLEAPHLAQYMHKAWKKHQNTVYWVDINLALKEGLKFYQTRSNAIILHETLPAYCIPKVVRMETGEVIYEKVYASPRAPPKISLKHDWTKELGSEVARQTEGEKLFNNPKVHNQANQIQTQIMIERGKPLFALKQEQPKHVSFMRPRTSTLNPFDDGSDVSISPMSGTSSNYGSPCGSGPDLDGMGPRSIDAQFKELRDFVTTRAWIRRF